MKLSNYLNLIGVVFGVFCFSLTSHAGVIKVGDAVQVALRGVPAAEQAKVNGQFRVRDDGSIRIPIINVNIKAAGQKPATVERKIEEAFKKAQIYVSPTISIQVVPGGDGVVFQKIISVGGHVKKPGRVQFREGMTLLEAIQQAGDRSAFGSKNIFLTRKNPKTGKLIRYKYSIKDPAHQSLKVYPNDLIEVPQKAIFE